MSKKTGFKLKNLFCDVLDVLIPESGSKKGRHLKLLVEINLDRPLLICIKMKCNKQEVSVDFKYENIAMFCFYCGKVGYSDRNCSARKYDEKERNLVEDQYGEWLRADFMRVGLNQTRETEQRLMHQESMKEGMG